MWGVGDVPSEEGSSVAQAGRLERERREDVDGRRTVRRMLRVDSIMV